MHVTFTEWAESTGLTREELTALIGIGESYLSHLFRAAKVPALKLAVKIEELSEGAVAPESWVRYNNIYKEAHAEEVWEL